MRSRRCDVQVILDTLYPSTTRLIIVPIQSDVPSSETLLRRLVSFVDQPEVGCSVRTTSYSAAEHNVTRWGLGSMGG